MSHNWIYQFKPFVQYNSYDAEYIPFSNSVYDTKAEAEVICKILLQDPDVFDALVFWRKISDWEMS